MQIPVQIFWVGTLVVSRGGLAAGVFEWSVAGVGQNLDPGFMDVPLMPGFVGTDCGSGNTGAAQDQRSCLIMGCTESLGS